MSTLDEKLFLTLDGAPYRNVRLVDAARLLQGAVRLRPPNPSLVTKLIARLVAGLEGAIVGVDGRAEAEKFAKTIRRTYSDLVLYLGPMLGEALEDGRMLGPWQLGLCVNPDTPPTEETVRRFDDACQCALEAYEAAGVPSWLISGPVKLTPDGRGDACVAQAVFESATHPWQAQAVVATVAARSWQRLDPAAREMWEAAMPGTAWAGTLTDFVAGGRVGPGAAEVVRSLLAVARDDLKETARSFRRAAEAIREVM